MYLILDILHIKSIIHRNDSGFEKVALDFDAADQPLVPLVAHFYFFVQVNPEFDIMKVNDIIKSLS